MNRLAFVSVPVLASALLLSAPTEAAETTKTPFQGATHVHRTGVTVGGAVQDYHLVTIDLSEPTLRVEVSPQADRNKTTSALGNKHKAKLAINGSFFNYADREPCGITQASGTFWTNAYGGCAAAIGFGPTNQVGMAAIGNKAAGPNPSPIAFATNTISGKPWVLKNGLSTGPWNDPSHINDRNPRTALGFGAGGTKLFILVADGRRAGAAGMVGTDLVSVMKEAGATDAMNLDGGGSSALFIPAENGVVNEPSDGTERAVSNAVMIVAAPPPPDGGTGSDAGTKKDAAAPSVPEPGPRGESSSSGGEPIGTPDPDPAPPSDDATTGGCAQASHGVLDLAPVVFALGALAVIARRRRVRARR